MKQLNLLNAVISAFTLLVLAAFLMGMQLGLDGTTLVVRGADAVRWNLIGVGCVVVVFFQLLRPFFQSGMRKLSGGGSCWYFRALTVARRVKKCWRRR